MVVISGEDKSDVAAEMYREITNYHAHKEDNMMSLMMELILKDVECDMDDIVSIKNDSPQRNLPQFIIETSDLGNSIQSSCSSRGGTQNNSVSILYKLQNMI